MKFKFFLILLVSFILFLSFYCVQISSENSINIPSLQSKSAQIFVNAARSQIGKVTKYDLSYFPADKVPQDSGVCTDVIWRALQSVNYDLKSKVDEDLAKNPNLYPTSPTPDPNVNFRRVNTLKIFLDRKAQKLTSEVIPNDVKNLTEWQAGDIVTFAPLPSSGLQHIAIISDKRRSDGVPLLIHNHGQGTLENDFLLTWPAPITGHYRLFH